MNYLYKQVQKDININETMNYLIDFFVANPNRKIQITELINNQFGFEQIDSELTKLVSRNLINEFYVDDKHLFEYTISSEIDNVNLADEIISELKIKGYRITDSRKKLIKIFTKSPSSHFTFDELVKLSGEKVNIATMYNNLSTLLDEKLINEFYIDDNKLFELNNKIHSHFICSKCKSVYNVETNASMLLEAEILEKYNLEVHTKRIELTGLCSECNETQNANNVTVVNENEYAGINDQELIEYFGYLQAKTNNNTKGITIVFLDTESIHNLNKEFRDIDRPTDVLTFVEDSEDYLGDILVCYDYIGKQANEYGHSFKRELYFLLTHGYLHLIGYDHLSKEDEAEMFDLQTKLLDKYGVKRDE